jgi:hypothetical protein
LLSILNVRGRAKNYEKSSLSALSFAKKQMGKNPIRCFSFPWSKMMNEETLKDKLNSIGKAVFVECFSVFKSYANSQISREDCIEELMQKYPDKKESGCKICCSQAKLIFEANMQCKAIGIICDNWGKKRLSDETIEQAMLLLQDCP